MSLRTLCVLVCLAACLSGVGCSSSSKRGQSMKKFFLPSPAESEEGDTEAEVGRMARGNRKKEKEPSDFLDNYRDRRVFEIERNVGISR